MERDQGHSLQQLWMLEEGGAKEANRRRQAVITELGIWPGTALLSSRMGTMRAKYMGLPGISTSSDIYFY